LTSDLYLVNGRPQPVLARRDNLLDVPELEPVDEGFFDTATVRFVGVFDIPRPAEDVWLQLTRDGALDHCRLLRGAVWTSPRPFGVGTTRTMATTGGVLVLDETFFRWEEGRRKSFYARRTNLPLFSRFAEDYLVEPTDAGCRFTWTLAGEPLPLARPGAPLNALMAKSLFADTRRHFGAR